MKKFLSHLYVFILSSLLFFTGTNYLIASEEEMNLKIENYLYTKIPIKCKSLEGKKLNGYYSECGYKGFFKDGYFDGLGDYSAGDNFRYIGEFKYDRMHGYGTFINSEWIVHGEFERDTIKGKSIRYGCNRRTGYIYPVVKISKKTNLTAMRKVYFGTTPDEYIIYNQNTMIRSTKALLSKLYYYKGPIDTKCNNGLFEAIKSFSDDENIKSYYRQFFINTINNGYFRETLLEAASYRIQ